MFTQFPYTNFQNLNLDWILKTMKDLPSYVQEQIDVALNNNFASASYDSATETITFKMEVAENGERSE